ncbi:uncharacterized protein LOC128295176 [Gossypium arboreum]|uniref:uncharacterized protein LOC128295176 n=1 Tax=Gossypium arboreum TaxID=29729 RepID=UPI0022F15BA0|nr:uncharacterized protein LOC128295176 [Gossypium arboreum]
MMRAQEADPINLEVLLALGVSHTNELEQTAALKYLYGWLRHHPNTIEFTGSLGTRFEAKLCACLGKHGYQLRQPGLSFCWMHGPGLVEFMHSDDLFELIADIKVCILSLFCSICILLDFWCSMISAVFCLIVIDKLSIWWDIYLYHRYYSSSQYFDNEF